MVATDNLVSEHDVILSVLDFCEKYSNKISQPDFKDYSLLEQLVEFLRNFTDKLHHEKEEKYLFTKMVERGMSLEQGPLHCMLSEHAQGRQYVGGIANALDELKQGKAEAKAVLLQNLKNYISLLRDHIYKENNILYNMANNIFTEQDQTELISIFSKVDKELMGGGAPEKYRTWAKSLSK